MSQVQGTLMFDVTGEGTLIPDITCGGILMSGTVVSDITGGSTLMYDVIWDTVMSDVTMGGMLMSHEGQSDVTVVVVELGQIAVQSAVSSEYKADCEDKCLCRRWKCLYLEMLN
ncbi:hypothetical protein HispidOSU_001117 [Sigmodon hispidus]